ncbi:hypothetical protein B0H11DRAFT_2038746 [Mycena galericulata]|nr:hypothetical protein B0H11DRAFT_2038746 [Mycena galericulata]
MGPPRQYILLLLLRLTIQSIPRLSLSSRSIMNWYAHTALIASRRTPQRRGRDTFASHTLRNIMPKSIEQPADTYA